MLDFQEDKRDLVKSAFLYSQEGKWVKAMEAYEKIVKLDPHDYNAINALGEMYAKRGLFIEAFVQFIAAAMGYEEQGNAMKSGNLYKKASRLDLTGADRELKKRQEAITKIALALEAIEAQENEKAEKYFREGLELSPQSAEFIWRFAEFLENIGRNEEARKYYSEAALIFFARGKKELSLKSVQRALAIDPLNEGAQKILQDLQAGGK